MKKIFFCLTFFLATAIFTAIMPYPVFSNFTNINESNACEINTLFESELVQTENIEPKIIALDFDAVSHLIEGEFEVFDLKSNQSFFAVRTGGKEHLDIEPIDDKNTQILKEMRGEEPNWERRPALVKISEHAYVPASITLYPHGYTKIENNLHGHLCLHFKDSKMDGTDKVDSKHQRAVKFAQNHGQEFLKNLNN